MIDLSIIIPSYNTCRLLINCLASIYQNTKTSFEVIIVDNGSTDGTIEAIKSFALLGQDHLRGVLIENKMNLGFAKAINQGLEKAQGRYLLILNSDTIILDGVIDKEITFLETHAEVGVVGCQLKNLDKTIQPSGGYSPNLINIFFWMSFLDDLPILEKFFKAYHVENRDFYTHQRYLGWVTGAFFLTQREVFDKVGSFDEAMFMYVEEVDWCTRVKKIGYKIALDPSTSIIHYKGASTKRGKAGLPAGKAGILEEFQGLKYYFSKYKPSWQAPILRLFLKLGALLRIFIFGIILKDLESKRIYAKAFRMV